MRTIEELTDAEIAEVHRSTEEFAKVVEETAPLKDFLSLVHAFDWLNIRDREDVAALHAYFDGTFGNPVDMALDEIEALKGNGRR